MESLNREEDDFGNVRRQATAPASDPSPVSGRGSRIGKRVLCGVAVLGLALLATGPLACQYEKPQPDEDATREEKPKYDW
ncbi:MAG: hypothetical protein ABFS46_05260 [Myxococcota bacterium]